MDASNLIVLAVRSPLGGIAGFIENIAEYLDQAERRNRVLRILWFLCTVAVVVVTAILSGLLYWLLGWKAASFAGVTLWAIYLGATGLLFLPPKAMTAVFGTMLGISLSEVSSGAGLIAAAHKAVAALFYSDWRDSDANRTSRSFPECSYLDFCLSSLASLTSSLLCRGEQERTTPCCVPASVRTSQVSRRK